MSLDIDCPPAQKAVADQLMQNIDKRAAQVANHSSYTLVNLAGVKPEKVRWLWRGHIPQGKSTDFSGDPGQGKSTVAVDLAARVTTGASWPDGAPGCEPGDVILMSAEDGLADTILPRLLAAGADAKRVHALETVMGGDGKPVPPMLPEALPQIEKAITDRGAKLLVMDVFMSYLDGSVNSYKDQDIRAKVMTPLTAMLARTNCSAMLLRHLNKTQGGNAVSRGGGSIGIIGAVRAGYVIASDPSDETRHVMAPSKFNLGRMPKSLAYTLVDDPTHGCARVHWMGESEYTADKLVTIPSESDEEKEERGSTQTFLLDYLESQGGEAPAKDVLKAGRAAGIDDTQMKHARYRSRNPRVVSRKASMGSGWVWAIDCEGAMNTPASIHPQTAAPSAPSNHSADSQMAPSSSMHEGAKQNKMEPSPAYSLNLDRIDSVVIDDILAGYKKKLAADPSALDAKLPRMSPVTLEMLSQHGGILKTLADREFQRRADSFTTTS
jgi:hypothetical protein